MKNIIISLLLLYTLTGIAQDSTFNNFYTLGYPTNRFSDIIVHNDTIVGIGIARTNDEDFLQSILVARFDSSGLLIDEELLVDPLGGYYSITKARGKILRTSSNQYLLTVSSHEFLGATIIKLNDDLTTEWIQYYTNPITFNDIDYGTPIKIPGGYILFGKTADASLHGEAIAQRIDEQGNSIWIKQFGFDNASDSYTDMRRYGEDKLIACGSAGIGNTITFIHILDFDGNLVDSWQSPIVPEIGYIRKAYPLEDGSIILYGQYITEQENGILYVQNVAARLSSDFELLWSLQMGPMIPFLGSNGFYDMEPTSDGNIICAGELILPGEAPKGWLFKFSTFGYKVWSHRVIPPAGSDDSTNPGCYGGVDELSSGSYIAGGYGKDISQNYAARIWLTKVTNDGCLADFCPDLNIVSTESPPLFQQAAPQVVPNPGSGPFRLSWPEGEAPTQPVQVIVRDVSGQPVWQGTIGAEALIPLGGVPAGVYLVEVVSKEGRWVKKVVKQ